MRATALGEEHIFADLAKLLQNNKKEWRKVARMISKYNNYRVVRLSMSVFDVLNQRRKYLVSALIDTHLSVDVRRELCRIYGIHLSLEYIWT